MSLVKEHVIALVDCDCFFVSCERVDNPKLNGKPVCVTTGATSKGIVVSRSKEAKALRIECHLKPQHFPQYLRALFHYS